MTPRRRITAPSDRRIRNEDHEREVLARPTGRRPAGQGTPTLLDLQRRAGNQAVVALLNQGGRVSVQRWNLKKPDWDKTKSIETLTTGRPVLFFNDTASERMVVKASNEPIGMNQLAADVHARVDGANQVVTTDVTPDKEKIEDLIANKYLTQDESWRLLGETQRVQALPGDYATTKARNYQLQGFKSLGKVVAMGVAPGQTLSAMTTAAPPAQGERPSRTFLGNPKHMYELGRLSAADLFLNNADRVMSKNLGNLFVDARGAITLIDNVDAQVEALMKNGTDFPAIEFELANYDPTYGLGANDSLAMISTGQLANTATRLVGELVNIAKLDGDARIDAWLNTPVDGNRPLGNVMATAFRDGLADGRERILKTYGKRKGKAMNAAKAAATADDVPIDRYRHILYLRAVWLKAH